MNTVIKCEVCQYETTVEELFEDSEITVVCEPLLFLNKRFDMDGYQ